MASDTPDPAAQPDMPETEALLLATFAELYRHEVGARQLGYLASVLANLLSVVRSQSGHTHAQV